MLSGRQSVHIACINHEYLGVGTNLGYRYIDGCLNLNYNPGYSCSISMPFDIFMQEIDDNVSAFCK